MPLSKTAKQSLSSGLLAEGGHGGVYSGADAGGPAGGYGFQAGVEAHAFGAVDGVVAEEGALPASEAVEGHGDGDGHVDAYHADLDAVDEVAGGVAVAGEDGGPVAVLVLVDHLEGGFEVVDAHDSEDGSEDLLAVDLHVGLYVVEEAGSEEEAFAPGKGGLTAVYDELSALLGAVLDVGLHFFEMRFGDERAELCALLHAVADLEFLDALLEFAEEGVGGGAADGDGDGDCHAAFASGAVGGTDKGIGGLVEVGVGHDDHVVFGSAEGLDALAVPSAFLVDVFGDGGGTDEADGLDGGVGEDGVDGDLVSLNYVEDTVGEAGVLEHLGEEDGGAGVALAGLEDEGVAAGEGDGEHPHGDHGGEVEGRDAGDDSEGLAEGPAVDAGTHLLGELAFEELRDAGGKFDVFEASSGFAAGVGEDFAVLAGEELGDFVEALLEDFAEAEEDAGSPERRLGGPFGKGCCCGGDGSVDFGGGGQGNAGLWFACGGIVDIAKSSGTAYGCLAVDPVMNFAQFLVGGEG